MAPRLILFGCCTLLVLSGPHGSQKSPHEIIDEFKPALENCEPRIIADALLAHEERHVRQCVWHRDNHSTGFTNPTGEGLGLAEAAAHLAGIRKALSWYEDHCSGETVSLRRRMAAAERKLAGTPW